MIGSLPRRCGSMTTVWLKASLSAAVDGAATRAPARPTSATAEPRTAGLLRGRTCRLQTVVGSSPTPFAAQPAIPSARRVNPMTTVVLVRHGLTAMTGPVLAGWTPGLHLDERGQKQAIAVAERLREVPFAALVSSPLDRCLDTTAAIAEGRDVEVQVEDRLGECRYGDWTGRPLKELAKVPLWKVVQAHPSAAVFPGPEGEPLRETADRAVAAVRDWNAKLGADATWLACSHGDVIKAIVADALGLHLDQFQRISVDPCSVTVPRNPGLRLFVVRLNDPGGGVAALLPPKKKSRRKPSSDAVVGGGEETWGGFRAPPFFRLAPA